MSLTSFLARQLCQSAPSLAPSAAPASSAAGVATLPSASSSAIASSASALRAAGLTSVRMVGHPVRHGLHSIELAVDRHQQEEQEIDRREEARQVHVQTFRRLQPEIAERDEGHGEQ